MAGGVDTACATFLGSKDAHAAPRGRIACYASSTVGTRYPDPFHLGPHSYRFNMWERNGIVYTCRGGHIDVTHLRKAADWTAYLACRVRQTLLSDKTRLSYRMREPSKYRIVFEYPKVWTSLPPETRERVASDVAIQVAQYCTFTGMVWHEILTWFGYKSIGFYPEYPSAFSWEDVYSNLVGSRVAVEALRDPDRGYEEAMTALIDQELQRLGVKPRHTAWKAGEAVRGQWFVGDFLFCDMVKRNFDVGWDDGFVTPWLVSGMTECSSEAPALHGVPDLSSLGGYGFSARLEIEPREWERKEILRIVYPDRKERTGRIEPAKHFGPIMEGIRARAIQRYGPYVDDQSLPSRARPKPFASEPVETDGGVARSAISDETSSETKPGKIRTEFRSVRGGYARPDAASGDTKTGLRFDTAEISILAEFWLGEEF
jgi:hypothetical protein